MTLGRSVYVRPIIELVTDFCSDDTTNHEVCATLWVAARWPNPQPGHDLDLYDRVKGSLDESAVSVHLAQ